MRQGTMPGGHGRAGNHHVGQAHSCLLFQRALSSPIRIRFHALVPAAADAGIYTTVEQSCLDGYERMCGLQPEDLVVNDCPTKARWGGEAAG